MKSTFYVVFLLFCSSLGAQNLVPNPSFENYINCPLALGELPFPSGVPISVQGWTRPTRASSDYHHACGQAPLVNVPENISGYQYARTGNAYLGIHGIQGFYREYVQTKLSAPLIAGHRYYANYWISLGEVSRFYPIAPDVNAIDQMGAYFSLIEEERPTFDSAMSDLIPQVKSPAGFMLTDTAGWMNIEGSFIAAGNEQYMIIGNFTHKDSFHLVHVAGNDIHARNYYYIDDVCVLDLDGPALTTQVLDTVFCQENIILRATLPGRSYLWQDGSTLMEKEITGPGMYWVKSMALNDCSFHIDSFHVLATGSLPVNLGNDTVICPSLPLTLNVFNTAYVSYAWSTGETGSSITLSEPGTYFVHITSACATGSDTIVIGRIPLPKATLPADTLLCKGDVLVLRYEQTGLSPTWGNGETGCCLAITEPGTYTLTVSNICGEKAMDAISASFTTCKDCIFAPTAFSPNEDGLNDDFEVRSDCALNSFGLKIFNRWGQLVFSTTTLDKKWDGLVNGAPAEVGVYFYQLHATPSLSRIDKIVLSSDLTLIR